MELKQHLLSAHHQNLPKEKEQQDLKTVVLFAVIQACRTVSAGAPMAERDKEEEIPQTDPIFAALAGTHLRQLTTLARLYTSARMYSWQRLHLEAGEKGKQVGVSDL